MSNTYVTYTNTAPQKIDIRKHFRIKSNLIYLEKIKRKNNVKPIPE